MPLLTLALQVHGQEKSFHCSQCDKSFKELRTLRLHLKIHNSEYPEHCEVCKKGFRTKWQVRLKMVKAEAATILIFCS
jgi:NAD-dependent SIR2 family protein deacetylase